MPKKHRKHTFAKPVNTVHPSLASSTRHHDSSSRASSSSTEPSVNDLINHLRRTQVSSHSPSPDTPTSSSSSSSISSRVFVAPRSVHPSLRNLLELPETPPPRPRPNARRGIGVVTTGPRARRTPGPPPPQSWLAGNTAGIDHHHHNADEPDGEERVIFRLERLPGATFPRKDGLLHTVLKAMARHWAWHVDYDGAFLARLPGRVRGLLMSYVAVYGGHQQHRAGMLRLLFPRGGKVHGEEEEEDEEEEDNGAFITPNPDSEVTRLDLAACIGRSMTLKQLTNELVVPTKNKKRSEVLHEVEGKAVPASWDEEADDDDAPTTTTTTPPISIPKAVHPSGLRFESLRFLSLAHPRPESANWNSLLNLLSRLSILTHLSLAHWPVPTLTPNAMHARIRHPVHRSLTFSYSGTDSYADLDNNWAEAAAVLRKLSRATYCLKWLDLEGCGAWLPALAWHGGGSAPDREPSYPSAGPEWNASWRDVEWVGLGPGWVPNTDDIDEVMGCAGTKTEESSSTSSSRVCESRFSALRGLAASVHATTSDSSWDVEVERFKYRQAKEWERYRGTVHAARAVQRRVLQLRREGKRKWIHFDLGLHELDRDVLRKIFGSEYSGVVEHF